jgi:hypothetical protein
MKRILILFTAVAAVALAIGTVLLWQRNVTLTQDFDNVRASRDAAQTQYGDAVAAIASIQDSLATLGVGEATGPLLPGSPSSERGLTAEQQRNILDRIALLKAGIVRTRQRIHDLESRLHASGVRVAGLEHMIVTLKRVAAERDAQLAALGARVDSLHVQVTDLTATVSTTRDSIAGQARTLEDQRHELGTVYYVIGSRAELQRAGVVRPSGGVLGLGRTLLPAPGAAASAFRPLDTDAQTVLTIPAPRARVVSGQPATSYQLVSAGRRVELRITDPREFRTVKRLVIVSMS